MNHQFLPALFFKYIFLSTLCLSVKMVFNKYDSRILKNGPLINSNPPDDLLLEQLSKGKNYDTTPEYIHTCRLQAFMGMTNSCCR